METKLELLLVATVEQEKAIDWLLEHLEIDEVTEFKQQLVQQRVRSEIDELLEAKLREYLKQVYYSNFVFEKTANFTDESPEYKKFDETLFNETFKNGQVLYEIEQIGQLGDYLADFFQESILAYPQLTIREKDALVLRHEALVYKVIHETKASLFAFVQRYDLFDDLVGIGMQKLREAADTFTKVKHRPFTAYASICLRREIDRAIIREIEQQKERVQSQGFFEEDSLESSIPSKEDVEADCVLNDTLLVLHKLLQQLNAQEQFIVVHTYGLYGKKKLNQAEIAEELSETQPTISKQKKQILNKLKQWCIEVGITDLKF